MSTHILAPIGGSTTRPSPKSGGSIRRSWPRSGGSIGRSWPGFSLK
jgi:hypothetical protein